MNLYRIMNKQGKFWNSMKGREYKWSKDGRFFTKVQLNFQLELAKHFAQGHSVKIVEYFVQQVDDLGERDYKKDKKSDARRSA